MTRRFRQVDVFGEGSCTGNPVAVVLDAEGLNDEALRRFAVWSNLSECTFVLPPTTAGSRTLCPRLEIGKSSETPWRRPTMAASSQLT